MNHLTFLCSTFLLCSCAAAQHTFSICAVDTVTWEVGSAGASCIGNSVIISDVHPGIGVIHTQAAYLSVNQQAGRAMMQAGFTPQEIIDSLVAGDFISGATNRQYGAAGFYGGAPLTHAYTGVDCIDYKNHIIGSYYTIQGNILLGQQILDSMEARFLRAEGDLACRLMAAMQGANVAGADIRCTGSGNSSLSAFLRVAKNTDDAANIHIDLNVPGGPAGFEPIDSLQKLFDLMQSCAMDTTTDTTGVFAAEVSAEILRLRINDTALDISINGKLPENARFELYALSGKKILSQPVRKPFEIFHAEIIRGSHVWRIVSGNNIISSGKILLMQ